MIFNATLMGFFYFVVARGIAFYKHILFKALVDKHNKDL